MLAKFPKSKTSENIEFEQDQILTEAYCDPANTPVTTDKGANMVAATAQKIRIDCGCHRINTAIKTGWERAMMENEELDQLHDDVNKAVTFAKKSSGILSELPISLKKGGKIRPWRSLYSMFNSILQSYGKLLNILTEKNKAYIVAE
ncbi:hypothetical protein LOD99_588 [Oopsacas minuta]|uniref:Uncharacterized protein n=1 Tax=Oopsacas minuta TaxID=111878 RepID=A0AAV7K913_9METZ|nr:hypothetical protein LOD99_588 [Oopsacas minuta]